MVYTDQQRLELEKEFQFNRYITMRRKTELSGALGLSERQVRGRGQVKVRVRVVMVREIRESAGRVTMQKTIEQGAFNHIIFNLYYYSRTNKLKENEQEV